MENNTALKLSIFNAYPELVYGFTGKQDGSMKIFDASNKIENKGNRENKRKYFSKLGVNIANLVQANLVARDELYVVSDRDKGKVIDNVDALVTSDKNIFLAITVADCFPVYFYVPAIKTVAIAHAGWRGVAENIVLKTLEKIDSKKKYRENILVGIGPGIKSCHFEVKSGVAGKFKDYQKFIIRKNRKIFIDLQKIIKHQLIEAGIPVKNIEKSLDCTYCLSDKYFSWRREKDKMEQGLAYIGIR